jgi:RNA polymerase sigma factor (sigma-70 family)
LRTAAGKEQTVIDDATLLRRFVEDRSEAAFSELVRRHVDLVYSVACRELHANAARADDVVQEVFTALARKAPALQRRTSLAGWLHVSVRHAAANLKRSEQRRQYREQEAHAMYEQPSSLSPDAWEKLEPVLNEAIDALNETDREAVLLRFYQHRRFHEIGALLRLSENAARHRVDRALEKMRRKLQRRGITSTAAALAVLLETNAVMAAPTSVAASVVSVALAGGTGVGATAGFWILMNTTKVISAVAVAAALLATFSAMHEAWRAREALASANSIRAEREQLRGSLQAAEKRAEQAGAELAAARRRLAEQPAIASGQPDAKSARAGAWQATSPVNYALDHPEGRSAFIDQEVSRSKTKFARFFKVAGLSPDEQERFLAIMKNFAEAKLDLTASVRDQGFGPNNVPQDPQALTTLFTLDSQMDAEYMGNLRALLGDDRFKQFSTYRRSLPEWNVADQLAGQLYDSDAPLTSEQAQQLVRVLRDNRYDKKATPTPTNTVNGTFIPDGAYVGAVKQSNMAFGDIMMPNIDWAAPVTDAAMTRVGTVLAPTQLAALRRLQAQQAAQLLLAPPPPKQPDVSATVSKPTSGK